MKHSRISFLVGAFLLAGQSASAQTTLSVHGGLNVSVLSNEVEDSLLPTNYLRISQPTFGLGATFRFTPPERTSFGIQLNASYSPRGGDLEGISGVEVRMKYLELAALADMRVPLILEPVALHFLVGPTAGWLISCKRELSCADGEFRSLDIGLSFGGQLEVASEGGVGVTAGFQYNLGITHADAAETIRHRAVALRGGIMFPLG